MRLLQEWNIHASLDSGYAPPCSNTRYLTGKLDGRYCIIRIGPDATHNGNIIAFSNGDQIEIGAPDEDYQAHYRKIYNPNIDVKECFLNSLPTPTTR